MLTIYNAIMLLSRPNYTFYLKTKEIISVAGKAGGGGVGGCDYVYQLPFRKILQKGG